MKEGCLPGPPGGRRLESWKEIAAHLKRDVATTRRWEKREGLPVHRHHHDKAGSVYAYTTELDAWRESRSRRPEPSPSAESERLTRRRLVLKATLSAAILAGVVSAYFWVSRRPVPDSTQTVTSLAVLPFQALGEGTQDETLEIGMADALITRLGNLSRIRVPPLSAVLPYAGSRRDLAAVGRELRVDALVEGKIQRAGNRIRITVQLLSVREGTSLWTGTFDEEFTGIFAVQDSISQQVARALPLRLSSDEARSLTRRETRNAEAYRFYLTGRFFRSKRTQDGLKKAVDLFEEAVALDPAYALAHAGLADSFAAWSNFTIIPSSEAYRRARAAALTASELDPTLADPHATLGVVSLFHDWDWPAAEREFTGAITLEPDDATGHRHYGLGLMWMGRFDDATREIRRARELAPVDLEIHHNVAMILYWGRHYDEAIVEARKTLEMDPHFPQARRTVAKALVEKGQYPEAIAEFHQAIASGGTRLLKAELGHAYARSGQRDEARRILHELTQQSQQRHVSPYDMAILHVGLEETEKAFAWLEKSRAQRERWMLQLKVAPFLDPLRSDPRFADLMRRVGVWP
jgi:TolB-like protein/Flp pilus assembly protein TadD